MKTNRLVADLQELGDAPQKFRLFKAGLNRGRWRSGEQVDFIVDRPAFEKLQRDFKSRGIDLLIDYEHQSEGGRNASPTGKSLAAGWGKDLEWIEGDGLYLVVDWTKDAAAEIASRQYRYFSPVFQVDANSKRISDLYSVALTNTPAMVDIRPLAASEITMPPKELLDKLGLPENATWDEVNSTIDKMKNEKTESPPMSAKIAKALELDEKADEAAIVEKIGEIKAASAKADEKIAAAAKAADEKIKASAVDPAKFVPADSFKALQDEHKALSAKCDTLIAAAQKRDCETFIESGMKAGKIVASSKEMWERVWKADAAQAAKDLDSAPVIVAVGTKMTSGNPAPAAGGNDPIAANATKFDESRLSHHAKVKAYAEQNKCSYAKALDAVGAA